MARKGLGEVCGTGIEAPMRIVYQVEVLKGQRRIKEPQYENNAYYAVSAFAETIDAAAKNATRYMVDYLAAEHGMDRTEAYVLCSLSAELRIVEVVDAPNMHVSMRISKKVLGV